MKRVLCLVLALMILSLGMTTLASAEPATVKVGKMESSGGRDVAKEIIDAFSEETGTPIEYIEIPNSGDYYTKLALMLQSPETAPDFMYEDGFMVKSDSSAGFLEPLDDYLADWDGWAQYSGAMKAAGEGMDGKVYAISCGTDVQVMWYNADVFEAAGLPRDWQPTTWDEVLEAAKTLKEANADNPDFVPLFQWTSSSLAEATSMRTFQMMYAGTEGDCYNYETSQWVVDEVNFAKVLNFVDKAWNEYELCSFDLASMADPDTECVGNLLPNGNIGIFCGGSWNSANWAPGGTYEWDGLDKGIVKIAFFPREDGNGFTTVSGGWTWAIPALATNKEGAWELMKYFNDVENIAKYDVGIGNLPARSDAWETETFKNQPYGDFIAGFADSLNFTKFRDSVDNYNTVSVLYAQMVENVGFGVMSVEDAIATFEEDLIAAVGADNVQIIE